MLALLLKIGAIECDAEEPFHDIKDEACALVIDEVSRRLSHDTCARYSVEMCKSEKNSACTYDSCSRFAGDKGDSVWFEFGLSVHICGSTKHPGRFDHLAGSVSSECENGGHIVFQEDLLHKFLADGELKVQTLGRGFAWLDTGTHDSLSEASTYVEVLENRQGLKIACLEGIAYRQGWITEDRMRELAQPMLKNQYGQYLLRVIDEVKQTGKPNLG